MTPREKLKDLKAQAEFHQKEYERLMKEWEDNKPKSSFWGDWGKLSISQLAEFEKLPESEWKKKSDYYDLISDNSKAEFHRIKFGELSTEINELSREIYQNSDLKLLYDQKLELLDKLTELANSKNNRLKEYAKLKEEYNKPVPKDSGLTEHEQLFVDIEKLTDKLFKLPEKRKEVDIFLEKTDSEIAKLKKELEAIEKKISKI